MLHLTIALDVVLPSHEVPKEIPPIHEIQLIGNEETQVLSSCRQVPFLLHSAQFPTFRRRPVAHPVFVGLGMALGVHAGKEHVFIILVFYIVAYDGVFLGVG